MVSKSQAVHRFIINFFPSSNSTKVVEKNLIKKNDETFVGDKREILKRNIWIMNK